MKKITVKKRVSILIVVTYILLILNACSSSDYPESSSSDQSGSSSSDQSESSSSDQSGSMLYLVGNFANPHYFGAKIHIVNEHMENIIDDGFGEAQYITELTDNSLIGVAVKSGGTPNIPLPEQHYKYNVYLMNGTRLDELTGYEQISAYAYNGCIAAGKYTVESGYRIRLYDLNTRTFVTEDYASLKMVNENYIYAIDNDGNGMLMDYSGKVAVALNEKTYGIVDNFAPGQNIMAVKSDENNEYSAGLMDMNGNWITQKKYGFPDRYDIFYGSGGDYILARTGTCVDSAAFNDWVLLNTKTGEETPLAGEHYYIFSYENYYLCFYEDGILVVRPDEPGVFEQISPGRYVDFPKSIGDLCLFWYYDGDFIYVLLDGSGRPMKDTDIDLSEIRRIASPNCLDLSRIMRDKSDYVMVGNDIYHVSDEFTYIAEGFEGICGVTPDNKYFIAYVNDGFGLLDMNMNWVYKKMVYSELED